MEKYSEAKDVFTMVGLFLTEGKMTPLFLEALAAAAADAAAEVAPPGVEVPVEDVACGLRVVCTGLGVTCTPACFHVNSIYNWQHFSKRQTRTV